jgi:hypothetical protein
MTITTLRVDAETRDMVSRVAREDYGGLSHDATVRRLLEEHFQRRCIEQMDAFRHDDPTGYAEYLAAADDLSGADAPIGDAWDDSLTAPST